jgi:endonuclease-8
LPEGDTIFRAARTLQRALAGRTVTRFESVFPRLTRIDHDAPLRGRTIERVEPRGKHLLIYFSGDLVLRTHMRMHGSWHIYRPGERWQRPRHQMRIVIETGVIDAVAFDVPVAEFTTAAELERTPALRDLGPDLLAADFDLEGAVRRIEQRRGLSIAEALLDQQAIAGIGNIYKNEALFVARVDPFSAVESLPRETIEKVVTTAAKLMRANLQDGARARFWVYERGGKPCRRCGSIIQRSKQGAEARSTYWCETCQIPNRKSQAPNPNT